VLHDERRQQWLERERAWARRLNGAAARPWVVLSMVAVSRLGDGVLWCTIVAVLPFLGGPDGASCALLMVAIGLLNLCIYKYLKQRIARPRPYVSCPGVHACDRSLDEFSFPSGHAMHAAACSLILASYYPSLAAPVLLFTLLVALSRVVLGLHYLSDVAVGMAIGLSTATLALIVFF